jgi:hypothetical protein
MRLNRVACGIVAGVAGILAAIVVGAVESRFFGGPTRQSFWVALIGVGGAVFWLADWLGVVSSPYTPPTIDIYGTSKVDEPGHGHVAPLDIDDIESP